MMSETQDMQKKGRVSNVQKRDASMIVAEQAALSFSNAAAA